MRHARVTKRLGKMSSHRKAMLSNMAKSVLIRESIRTTKAKAKVAKSYVEKLITIAKVNTPASKRRVFALLRDKAIIDILFNEIAPRFKARNGGYTRVIPLYTRHGDGAQMSILELVEKKPKAEPKKKTKKEEAAAEKETRKAEKQVKVPKTAVAVEETTQAHPEQHKLDIKEDTRKEKARHEELKMKPNIFKNLKNYFGGRKAPK